MNLLAADMERVRVDRFERRDGVWVVHYQVRMRDGWDAIRREFKQEFVDECGFVGEQFPDFLKDLGGVEMH